MPPKDRIAYYDYKFEFTGAKESFIYDGDGNKLIDFSSGWNVTNLGWNHPEVAEAICEQAKKNTYAPMWTGDPIQTAYAKALTDALPDELSVCARATGGTEANEEAIKTARAFTGRQKILGFNDTYHGQSFATLALCSQKSDLNNISPVPEGFDQINFPAINGQEQKQEEILEKFAQELEEKLRTEEFAAIITEAGIVTGEGNTLIAPQGYLTKVRELTKKYGTLLILDEVGTGFSRCGKLFGYQIENVTPDIITLAKGISNGAEAIGAMITTEEISQKTCDDIYLISTFGWTPVACACAKKVLEIHQRERLWEKAEKDGAYVIGKLKTELGVNSHIESISGIGLEIGLLLKNGVAKEVTSKALENGLHLVNETGDNIQIMPPLTIRREVLDKGIDILIKTIKEI